MKLANRLGISLALVWATTGCSVAPTGSQSPQSPDHQAGADLSNGFSFLHRDLRDDGAAQDDKSRMGRDEGGEYRTFEVNGEEVRYRPDQLIVELNDDSKIGRLLQKYNATIMSEHGGSTVPSLSGARNIDLPTWWVISVPASQGDSYLDLEQNGPKAGLQGMYQVYDWDTAVLLAKMARITIDPELNVKACYMNYVGQADGR